jgi:O-methyltransferase involved in polyketide biosynthesis
LLATITELSAPASRVATENRPNPRPGQEEETKEQLDRMSARWRARSYDTDMAKLRYFGERNEAEPYLAGLGWTMTGSTIRDLLAANGLASLGTDEMRMGDMRYVRGILVE